MPRELAEKFIEALGRLESDQDVDAMVELFSEDCVLGNSGAHGHFHGKDGARQFWSRYHSAFRDMKSTFRNIIASERCAALEWTTEGSSAQGNRVSYDGVSVLEMSGDKISRFEAYFDTEELARQLGKVKPIKTSI